MSFRRLALTGAALCAGVVSSVNQTQTAVANGDTRTLTLYHSHTRENITVTFRRNGSYDRDALEKLNWFLRDWRKDEPINMDPRLFDVVWATQKDAGSTETVRVVSAYRSPSTNAMLRRRSSAVAKQSQHMLGKAMDFHLPDVSMAKVREMGMRLQRGGVGYYPTAGTPFVHLDVGSVRSWPRMPRQQLERLFPDGKTVHLPADGQPLPGYELALAEIQSRGGYAESYAEATRPRRSLWAALFGGEDEEAEVVTPRRGGKAVAARGGSQSRAPQQVAVAGPTGDSASVFAVNSAPALAPEPARAAPPPARPKPVEEKPAAEAPKPAVAVAALVQPKTPDDEEEPKAGPKRVDVPLPPRRPSDLASLALANVPAPPIRPAMVAMVEPSAPVAGWTAGDAPRADGKVAATELPAIPVKVPAPVPRPAAFATPSEATASIDRRALPAAITEGVKAEAPANALAFAPANVPAPPARPGAAKPAIAAPAAASAPAREAPTGKYALTMDSASMKSLIAGVAAEKDKPERIDKVAQPSVKRSVNSVVVASKFGDTGMIAETGKFTGTLVRPLSAGFVRKGE